MDHDSSSGNIAFSVIPEVKMTYYGNHISTANHTSAAKSLWVCVCVCLHVHTRVCTTRLQWSTVNIIS